MKPIPATIAAIVTLALAGACGGKRPPYQPPTPVPEPVGPGDPEPILVPTGDPVASPEQVTPAQLTPDAAPPPATPAAPGTPLVPGN